MSTNEISIKVCEMLREQLGILDSKVIQPDDRLDTLGADSLDFVEIIMLVENEFKIDIPDPTASEIETVGQLVEAIQIRLS